MKAIYDRARHLLAAGPAVLSALLASGDGWRSWIVIETSRYGG